MAGRLGIRRTMVGGISRSGGWRKGTGQGPLRLPWCSLQGREEGVLGNSLWEDTEKGDHGNKRNSYTDRQ